MAKIQIDPYEQFDRDQLIRIIKMLEVQKANLSQHVTDLNTEIQQNKKAYDAAIHAALYNEMRDAVRNELFQRTMAVWGDAKDFFGAHGKYALRDMSYTEENEKKQVFIRSLVALANYFDLD